MAETHPIAVVYDSTVLYNDVSSVPNNSETILFTYTVPVGKVFWFAGVSLSGTNKARYTTQVDSTVVNRTWTYFTRLSEQISFDSSDGLGIKLNAGQEVTIKVIHFRPTFGEFTATIVGILK